ncbi:MAG: hypothetical protein ABI927_02670 [Gaiellaceae bacterium]
MDAGEHCDAGETEDDAPDPRRPDPFMREKPIPISSEQSGTVTCAMAATPDSMWVSLEPTNQNRTAAFRAPKASAGRHAARRSASILRQPTVVARYAVSATAAISVRVAINVAGLKPPSTPTLMKRYEAPHVAASASRSGA